MIATTLLLLFAAAATAAAADPPPALAIRNATLHTASGPVIEKGTVVVRNGLIESAGPNVPVPADAWVVEGIGLHVYPGLMDALSTWGTQTAAAPQGRGTAATPAQPPASPAPAPARGPEDRPSTTSWLAAQDTVQPSHRSITAARNAGYTTAVVFPTTGIFAGQGAVMNLAGDKPGQMTVAAPAGQYVSLATRGFTSFPGSLMGAIAYVRQVILDAGHYAAARRAYDANPRGQRRPDYDRALEGILASPRLLLPATWKHEIDRMLRFGAEWKRPFVLYGGHEAYAAADLLRQAGAPVLINLKWPERERDADPEARDSLRVLEMRDRAPSAPAALAKAGVRFAFYSGGVERAADLRAAVKKAIDAGLPSEDAVRALTLHAAEIYGVGDRLGSIESGKIANLTVTNGDLFQPATEVKFVVIDGTKYEPAPLAEEREATR